MHVSKQVKQVIVSQIPKQRIWFYSIPWFSSFHGRMEPELESVNSCLNLDFRFDFLLSPLPPPVSPFYERNADGGGRTGRTPSCLLDSHHFGPLPNGSLDGNGGTWKGCNMTIEN